MKEGSELQSVSSCVSGVAKRGKELDADGERTEEEVMIEGTPAQKAPAVETVRK